MRAHRRDRRKPQNGLSMAAPAALGVLELKSISKWDGMDGGKATEQNTTMGLKVED